MFKPIPGNNVYTISLNKELRDFKGSQVNIPIIDNKIKIEMYGEIRNVDLDWLSLLSHFEINLPNPNFNNLELVSFVNIDTLHLSSISGKMVVFKKPFFIIYNRKTYRIIPNFSRYAISNDGDVIEIESLHHLKVKENKDINRYPKYYLYNPEMCSYKYVSIHRLVAYAWISNNDYVKRPFINHKNGDKHDYNYKNLEWCDFYENNIHAINSGLRKDNIKCKVRDFYTGVVTEFSSLSQACSFMGLGKRVFNPLAQRTKYNIKSRLVNKQYEFKLLEDNTPWYYENKTKKEIVGRYIIKSISPEGIEEVFYQAVDFKKRFRTWNCPSIQDMIYKARMENPGYKFEYEDLFTNRPIQCYNVKNKIIFEEKSIRLMAERLGMPKHYVQNCIAAGEHRVRDGFAFRFKTDKDWNTNFEEHKKFQIPVLAHNKISGEEFTFDSYKQAARILNIDRGGIRKSASKNIYVGNWKFTKIQVKDKYKNC